MYAIFQKFTDQGISADVYDDLVGNKVIDSDKLLNEYFAMIYYGLKGWYYRNTRASEKVDLSKSETAVSFDEVGDCTDGSCKM
jgi:ribonucleoside-diphosphate reductase alpha chain